MKLSLDDILLVNMLEREVSKAEELLKEYKESNADTWYITTVAGKIDGLNLAIRIVKGA